ncbi:hypothetical protein COV20_05460 [Candidatus Woesearchaeota archaeon CG10_big_fil_rev_8_21_14_0_10_45_16]|nr:MAG: hypothetical protein COV20_05460 [Candidatus Woesearchaeota archaeon CG10_big_fil_rev_8_21_14_0_10_45_16]
MGTVHIKDRAELQRKIDRIKKDGISSLHVISDFDKTLTTAFVDGEKVQSTYALIRNGKYLSPEYVQRSHALFDKYHPYEAADDLMEEERNAMMVRWWKEHYQMMVDCGLSQAVIKDIIRSGKLRLRAGASALFHSLADKNIPLLIFSAGQGDIITEFLKQNGYDTPNVHVISNFFTFSADGLADGYKEPFIHTFNKNEVVVRETPYYQQVKDRRHVILLGDSLGDLGMSEGLEHDVIIKIGFLNENKEKFLKKYLNMFDVVITDDSGMEYVDDILTQVLR